WLASRRLLLMKTVLINNQGNFFARLLRDCVRSEQVCGLPCPCRAARRERQTLWAGYILLIRKNHSYGLSLPCRHSSKGRSDNPSTTAGDSMSLINTTVQPFSSTAFHIGKFVPVTDAGLRGKWSVLVFMPAAFTFNCPTEVEDAAESYAEFEKLGA